MAILSITLSPTVLLLTRLAIRLTWPMILSFASHEKLIGFKIIGDPDFNCFKSSFEMWSSAWSFGFKPKATKFIDIAWYATTLYPRIKRDKWCCTLCPQVRFNHRPWVWRTPNTIRADSRVSTIAFSNKGNRELFSREIFTKNKSHSTIKVLSLPLTLNQANARVFW